MLALARGVVETPLKLLDHARHMPVHRRAGRVGVARGDRSHDRCVIPHRLLRKIPRVEMLLHAPPQLCALFPQALDDELERSVTGSLGEAEMKIVVSFLA